MHYLITDPLAQFPFFEKIRGVIDMGIFAGFILLTVISNVCGNYVGIGIAYFLKSFLGL